MYFSYLIQLLENNLLRRLQSAKKLLRASSDVHLEPIDSADSFCLFQPCLRHSAETLLIYNKMHFSTSQTYFFQKEKNSEKLICNNV